MEIGIPKETLNDIIGIILEYKKPGRFLLPGFFVCGLISTVENFYFDSSVAEIYETDIRLFAYISYSYPS